MEPVNVCGVTLHGAWRNIGPKGKGNCQTAIVRNNMVKLKLEKLRVHVLITAMRRKMRSLLLITCLGWAQTMYFLNFILLLFIWLLQVLDASCRIFGSGLDLFSSLPCGPSCSQARGICYLTRVGTQIPRDAKHILNHWTIRNVLYVISKPYMYVSSQVSQVIYTVVFTESP